MNQIVTTPARMSPAFWYRVFSLASLLVTPLSTYFAAVNQPKHPELAVMILAIGTALTNWLNTQHIEAVKAVALDAATQAAQLGPPPPMVGGKL